MFTQKIYVFSLLLLAFTINVEGSKLKVSIYYEGLCSDSITFLNNQVLPAYAIIGEYVDLDLIPYGKASQQLVNGVWYFQCQHGRQECYSNIIQACALNMGYQQWPTFKFVNCVMGKRMQSSMQQCSDYSGLNWDAIKSCASSANGQQILARYGQRTHMLQPRLSFVPTTVFDDVYDRSVQENSLMDFLGTVCSRLETKPSGCTVLRGRSAYYWWM
ncbi:PREDICTED: gamma-interferon-inducible lysosomal thiol reductase-like [Nicrophorus vespilloides]|uniref:Gamma-interferon-inducible lysosomal thiol reductase-like n=1 Tax=Nicrophorus vespilloides TaxID=110193 RepID=A0ABM1MA31_NICVS|nr:PREDICTED: gamma-interferon-inducible lysosomal thiol reductase-like [Nicrophorus vespilloides]